LPTVGLQYLAGLRIFSATVVNFGTMASNFTIVVGNFITAGGNFATALDNFSATSPSNFGETL
jgi:hypothetical protein